MPSAAMKARVAASMAPALPSTMPGSSAPVARLVAIPAWSNRHLRRAQGQDRLAVAVLLVDEVQRLDTARQPGHGHVFLRVSWGRQELVGI
jgi:hypothetical protein